MSLCMKKSIITSIIAVLSFIVTISLIFVAAYAQQQEQAQQDQASSFIGTKYKQINARSLTRK